jgi:hypothetical protein
MECQVQLLCTLLHKIGIGYDDQFRILRGALC